MQEMSEREKELKQQQMFLYGKILEEMVHTTRAKYGLKSIDPEVLDMISEAAKHKYTSLITDLIETSRCNNSTSYLSQK